MYGKNIVLSVLGALTLGACQPAGVGPGASASTCPCHNHQAQTVALTRVEDSSHVCMVNDQYKGSTQYAVVVADKTYYGCCENCKNRLLTDAEVRQAKDPVTGETVDKSVAVIARDSANKVYYFANAETFSRYVPPAPAAPAHVAPTPVAATEAAPTSVVATDATPVAATETAPAPAPAP